MATNTIADIRERLARTETKLDSIEDDLRELTALVKRHDRKERGSIVIPVTVVFAGIEFARFIIEKFF